MGKENVHPNLLVPEADSAIVASFVKGNTTGSLAGGPLKQLVTHIPSAKPPVLNADTRVQDEVQRRRAAFEELVLPRRAGGDKEDLVQVWCDYVRWASDKGGICDDEAVLLSRACCALAADPRYRSDARHLRLWVRHAGNSRQPENIFEYLDRQGIGVGHALLYEAWATALEQQRRFEEAAAVYHVGFSRHAEPLERLRERLADFEDRMRRRAARASAAGRSTPQGDGDLQATSQAALACPKQEPPPPVAPEPGPQPPPEEEPPFLEQPVKKEHSLARPAARTRGREEHDDVSAEELRAEWLEAHNAGQWPLLPEELLLLREAEAAVALLAGQAAPAEVTATQELTTSGVRALLARGASRRSFASSASRLSAGSSAFEDPTCTMEQAKREVLGLLANDPDRGPERECWSPEADSAGGSPLAADWFNGKGAFGSSGRCGPGLFQVFEEEGLDADRGGPPSADSVCIPPLPLAARSAPLAPRSLSERRAAGAGG